MEGEDAPFYYTERANVGVLSGAAWKAGWLALEEFGVKKRGKKRGSCDLYIHSIDGKQGEYIEAKHTWSIKSASDALSQAKGDARKLLVRKNEEALVIAVVFVAPSINKKFEEQINVKIREILRYASSKIKCDAYAWSFPFSVRNLKGGGSYKNYIFPGVLLFAELLIQK